MFSTKAAMRLLFPVLFLNMLFITGLAQSVKPRITPEPSWITKAEIPYAKTHLDREASDGYIYLSYQKQISLQDQLTYCQQSLRFLSEAGVQSRSEINIAFDPSYQQLQIHTVNIIRSNKVINKLDATKLKTIQQENEISDHLYNGSLTTLLILEDVQKGDVLEYSYSHKGFNPIFGNRYAAFLDLQYSIPVYHILYKVCTPVGRSLQVKNLNSNIQPFLSAVNGQQIMEWQLADVTALRTEEKTPDWHNPFPSIMLSEYKNWKEVADWASNLFRFDMPLSASLLKKINDISNAFPTAEGRATAAVRFVQDDIRYMGFEMGANSHQPHHPDKIFTQRFGDCKDKSYLLCTMLRKMGIEANPVMIHTSVKKSLMEYLPSPIAFDHVTTQILLNGTLYYIDPTISMQRGTIQQLAFPDYQAGLVITPNTTSITSIPLQDKGKISVKEFFKVTDMSGLAHLVVTTTNTGSFADDARKSFATKSEYDIRKQYQEFYSGYFKSIRIDSMQSLEDTASGGFIVKEYYTVPGFWDIDGKRRTVFISPFVISGIFNKVKETDRKSSYALYYPAHYKEEVEIQMPDDWTPKKETTEIKNSCFDFNMEYKSKDNRITLLYEYKALKDHIATTELDQYRKDYDKVNQNISYEIWSEDNAYGATSSLGAGILSGSQESDFFYLYFILGLCVVITFLVKQNR